ncbi:hypothetical protein IMY05_C4266001100 [Salix suchowensis]|nr:hypothetical protein IMY05_C4266001100 [Salix suchowensis]
MAYYAIHVIRRIGTVEETWKKEKSGCTMDSSGYCLLRGVSGRSPKIGFTSNSAYSNPNLVMIIRLRFNLAPNVFCPSEVGAAKDVGGGFTQHEIYRRSKDRVRKGALSVASWWICRRDRAVLNGHRVDKCGDTWIVPPRLRDVERWLRPVYGEYCGAGDMSIWSDMRSQRL